MNSRLTDSTAKRQLLVLLILVAVLAMVIPALACVTSFSSVTGTASCQGYTITVKGVASANSSITLTYTVNLTPTGGGTPLSFSGTTTATSDSSGDFTGTASGGFGTLNGTFTVSGSVDEQSSGAKSDISFSSNTLTCQAPPPPPCEATATNSSNFNGTPVSAGSFIWFNSHFKATNVKNGTVIDFTQGTITFTAGGTSYNLAVPDAEITFSSNSSCTSTSFDSLNNRWVTTVPISGDDEIFLTGLAWPVPSGGLPGGVNPVNFNGTYSSSTPGVSIQMQWSAAAYSSFTTDYNKLQIKAGHQTACGVNNGDHAGTPEGVDNSNTPWKHFVVGGARGGGGSNFTGSWSGTLSIPICP
jgi:hypothetical protein